jgi:hypothetical protein
MTLIGLNDVNETDKISLLIKMQRKLSKNQTYIVDQLRETDTLIAVSEFKSKVFDNQLNALQENKAIDKLKKITWINNSSGFFLYDLCCEMGRLRNDDEIDFFIHTISSKSLDEAIKHRFQEWDPDLWIHLIKSLKGVLLPGTGKYPISYPTTKPSWSTNLSQSFDCLFDPPSNEWIAMQRLQSLGSVGNLLVSGIGGGGNLVRLLVKTGGFYTSLGYSLGFLGSAAILSLIARIAYIKHFPKIPEKIAPLSNYTLEGLERTDYSLFGREEIINKVFAQWSSSNSMTRRHPLLIGPPGVGKSEVLMEIARRIVRGEIPKGAENMKDKIVFGGEAARLLPDNPSDQSGKLDQFLIDIDPFKSKVIVALDEVHVFMSSIHGETFGQRLKSVLDASRGLPYFIGATTQAEYDKYFAKDLAFVRRFVIIKVEELSSKDVLCSLRDLLHREYPQISITEDVLEYLYTKTKIKIKQEAQPDISKKILLPIILKILNRGQVAPSVETLDNTQKELNNIQLEVIKQLDQPDLYKESIKKIELLQKEIFILNYRIGEEEKLIKEYNIISQRIVNIKDQMRDLFIKNNASSKEQNCIIDLGSKKEKEYDPISKKLLHMAFFALPTLEKDKAALAQKLKIPKICSIMVDESIEEHLKNNENSTVISSINVAPQVIIEQLT